MSIKDHINKIVILLIFVPVIAIGGIIVWFLANAVSDYDTAATITITIDGKTQTADIAVGEMKLYMSLNRAQAVSYYYNKYNMEMSKDFWDDDSQKETPLEYLKRIALDDLIKIKIRQMHMQYYGILGDISYETFIKNLEDENVRREIAFSTGINEAFGVREYSIDQYYRYLDSKNDLNLKKEMSKENRPLYLSEEGYKEYYEQNKARLYKKEDTAENINVTVKFNHEMNKDKFKLKRTQEEAENLAKEISEKLKADKTIRSIEKISALYKDTEVAQYDYEHEFASSMAKASPEVFSTAREMKEGAVSDPVFFRDCYVVIVNLSKKDVGYKSYEEVQDNVASEYNDKSLDVYIDNKAEEAVISKVKAYNKLKPDQVVQ